MNCTTTPGTTTHSTMASSVPRLDTAGIAALLGLSREHVTDRLTKRVDFPKPYINVSRRTRYWRTSDVLAWMRGK
ncbi:UNVERIFIED_ORG: putative DNA-binding transcriptional regulator AlpA [Comamonas terrigena]